MLEVLAPAKINLFLHIIGKTKDNYHQLQSLVTFADFGDVITIQESDTYKLTVEGEFAHLIPTENNIITQAVHRLAKFCNKQNNLHIHLQKNIPVGAGLGGGSSDAAAVIKGLINFWDLQIEPQQLSELLLKLGADVPVCYESKTAFMEGIGERISYLNISSPVPAVLIYPHISCDTAEVFKTFHQEYSSVIHPEIDGDIIEFLGQTRNDLTSAARSLHPAIQNILDTLQTTEGCLISRMSGSGSCCFGIFENKQAAKKASLSFAQQNQDYWVKQTTLNSNIS